MAIQWPEDFHMDEGVTCQESCLLAMDKCNVPLEKQMLKPASGSPCTPGRGCF